MNLYLQVLTNIPMSFIYFFIILNIIVIIVILICITSSSESVNNKVSEIQLERLLRRESRIHNKKKSKRKKFKWTFKDCVSFVTKIALQKYRSKCGL